MQRPAPRRPLAARLASVAGQATGKTLAFLARLAGSKSHAEREINRHAQNDDAMRAVRRFAMLPRWYREILRPRFHLGPRVRYRDQDPAETRSRFLRAEAKRARRRTRTKGLVVRGGYGPLVARVIYPNGCSGASVVTAHGSVVRFPNLFLSLDSLDGEAA